jgi:four helix bundle protein
MRIERRASMNPEDFKKRRKACALRVIRLVEALPKNDPCRVLSRQLLRSEPSVGANYRAACRAKSQADFISKMDTVEEEADETLCWMELLSESEQASTSRMSKLAAEGEEILKITVASINTAGGNLRTFSNSRGANRSAIRNPQSAME